MTDIEVFKKFMGWMGMEVAQEKPLPNGNTLMIFDDKYLDDEDDEDVFPPQNSEEVFTTCGYDGFEAGILFDKEGNLVKGFLDSHVTDMSKNGRLLDRIIYPKFN